MEKSGGVTRSKSGFKTKREALEYLPLLTGEKAKPAVTFQGLYGMWLPTHQATKSTLDCYKAAYKYFSAVWYTKLDDISIDDLQECLDDCPKGKRTRQNMKALCGLLYKYAIPRGWADRNLGEYLVIHGESDSHKDALPLEALDQLAAHLESVPGADYVYCQCFLGFRPSELLALDCKDYDRKERAFVGGAKTDARPGQGGNCIPKNPAHCGPIDQPQDLWPGILRGSWPANGHCGLQGAFLQGFGCLWH